MAKNCTICGKSTDKLAVSAAHPEKPICLNCLNGFIVNLNTIEGELKPLSDALNKAATDLRNTLDKQQE
ncbi:MAG: hypothetical protein ACYCO0_02155 [Candidatus Micrarchaeaceae archaeon]